MRLLVGETAESVHSVLDEEAGSVSDLSTIGIHRPHLRTKNRRFYPVLPRQLVPLSDLSTIGIQKSEEDQGGIHRPIVGAVRSVKDTDTLHVDPPSHLGMSGIHRSPAAGGTKTGRRRYSLSDTRGRGGHHGHERYRQPSRRFTEPTSGLRPLGTDFLGVLGLLSKIRRRRKK